jgi:hypothetical protein
MGTPGLLLSARTRPRARAVQDADDQPKSNGEGGEAGGGLTYCASASSTGAAEAADGVVTPLSPTASVANPVAGAPRPHPPWTARTRGSRRIQPLQLLKKLVLPTAPCSRAAPE